ncbi:hypothetical protein [Variovorax sp. GB1P17]|uniref:hypothetical protein n=1 Tax=Variovorax sp. GB1P17 TaxID=3443740 RepID=UPI003F452BCD
MAETRKIAILRGRHDTSAIALTPALDEACTRMLVTSANPKGDAVLEYWTENTDGLLNFEVTMAPWVDVTFSVADVTPSLGKISRDTAFSKISAATRLLQGFSDLSIYDGFICLVAPGTDLPNPNAAQANQPATYPFDGGSSRGSYCVYPLAPSSFLSSSSHTFMCHEFGHVLGLFDDDGLPWGPGGSTGYGDPLDIMSAEAFAGSWPMFTGIPVPNWPNPNAKDRMGPAPSRAVVHYWNPDAQRKTFVKSLTVPDDSVPPVRLYAAYTDIGAPRLLVIEADAPQPYAIGRAYLEYRDTQKWDRGLEIAGRTLDRRSVVAHVAAMRPAPDFGAGDTIGNRCFYRGQILVPVEIDSDLKILGTPYTVRVVDENLDEAWVDVKLTRSNPLGFEIEVVRSEEIAGADGPIETRYTPCRDALHYATWLLIAHHAFRPVVWGLGGTGSATSTPAVPPIVRWTVGGVAIPARSSGGTLIGCQSPTGVFNVNYVLDATGTLHLSSTTPGQAYQMIIAATATDPVTAESVSAQSTFVPRGRFHGLPWNEQTAILRCLQRTVAVFPPNLRDLWPSSDRPRPNWSELATHVLERSGLQVGRYGTERRALEQLLELSRLAREQFR